MSPEKQRIAIAEACGWTPFNDGNFDMTGHLWCEPGTGFRHGREKLPDYLTDLNACAEFESKLTTNKQWELYAHHIQGHRIHEFMRELVKTFLKATAAQRSEALLKTLNLWEEAA